VFTQNSTVAVSVLWPLNWGVILFFHHEVDESHTLLGCCAVYNGKILLMFRTTYWSHLQVKNPKRKMAVELWSLYREDSGQWQVLSSIVRASGVGGGGDGGVGGVGLFGGSSQYSFEERCFIWEEAKLEKGEERKCNM
jgi:hypothetical protein